MKTRKSFTYGLAIGYGIALELFLIAIQYVLLAIYHRNNPGTPFSFNTDYMMARGFYIFLVPGFIIAATLVFFLMQRYVFTSFVYLFVFLLTAAVIEVGFYLTIVADYQGAFAFSMLDKIIGTGLGVIGYYAIGRPEVAK
jgi:hypothetical protein